MYGPGTQASGVTRAAALPGLVLLESARPGRNARWTYLTADPVAVIESPAEGADPFANARRLLSRLCTTRFAPARQDSTAIPPFLGGLAGFLGYDLSVLWPQGSPWRLHENSVLPFTHVFKAHAL